MPKRDSVTERLREEVVRIVVESLANSHSDH